MSTIFSFMISILSNPSFRRWLAATLTAAILALGNKIGLHLTEAEVISLVTLALGYIGASNAKEAAVAKADAQVASAAAGAGPLPSVVAGLQKGPTP